jgi:hypothetical protein
MHVRGLGRVHTLNCAAAANRSDFAAGLIRLFLILDTSRLVLWNIEKK